ncbi:MAG: GMC oxidoreductase [Kiloniellales bacterium]
MARYDAIVIGSGFGGAVAACRLSVAGRRVLVLERGRRWAVADYPSVSQDNWVWDPGEPEKDNGWIDLRVFRNVAVAQGAGVGGGSLVYANVFIKATPSAFDGGWPPEITYDGLQPFYDRAGEMLTVQQLPDGQLTGRHKMVREAAEKAGYADRYAKLDLAVSFDPAWSYDQPDPHNVDRTKRFTNAQGVQQGTCIHCGNCDIGCPVQAKNTLDLNYLAQAEQQGAEIRPLHLVTRLAPTEGGYRVDFDRLEDGRRVPGAEEASEVFFAAGSLGSTELLLRCRDEHGTLKHLSPTLGEGWSANGDFLTPTVYRDRDDVSPTRGPTITGRISFLDGAKGPRFFVQDGGFPDLIGNLLEHVTGKSTLFNRVVGVIGDGISVALRGRDPMRCVMPWFGQAQDAPDGRLRLDKGFFSGRYELELEWDPDNSIPAVQALVDMHKELSAATGGIPLVSPAWTLMHYLITPHPLGGCRMASSAAKGVVDHRGRVFGHPGLYVVDGAVIPRPVGLNPSRTIAAVAEYMLEQALAA